jgi:uncharacterized protein YukE
MGQQDLTRFDAAAVQAVANRFDDSAGLIDNAAHTHLGGLAFGGAGAGQAHIAHGDALHTALSRLTVELSQWARATREIATALRTTAGRYDEADSHAAARIG